MDVRMTLWATREEGSEQVVIHVSSGAVQATVTEHVSHVRSFWGSLGELVKEAEAQADADAPFGEPDTPGGF
jgi:hypothetical protein